MKVGTLSTTASTFSAFVSMDFLFSNVLHLINWGKWSFEMIPSINQPFQATITKNKVENIDSEYGWDFKCKIKWVLNQRNFGSSCFKQCSSQSMQSILRWINADACPKYQISHFTIDKLFNVSMRTYNSVISAVMKFVREFANQSWIVSSHGTVFNVRPVN